MIAQIFGIIAGIGIGYFMGQNINFKSKRNLMLVSIITPIILWILITFIVMSVEFNNTNNNSGQWSSLNTTFSDKFAQSLGMALGKFFFGYIAFGITSFRIGKKKINNGKNKENIENKEEQ